MAKDYTLEAINLVQNEKSNYEDASQDIRKAIKKARQNYACKFENPNTVSGREKTFIPLTRWEVDTVVPKIFVNDKAVTVLPENEQSVRGSFIADKTLKYQIRNTYFPTYFRNSMYDLGIDGTTVWAIFWNFKREVIEPKNFSAKVKKFFGKAEKPKINVLKDQLGFKQIDLLNVFIDPTADSIQDAPSFIYRSVMPLVELKRNKLYSNVDEVKGFTTDTFDTYDARSSRKSDIGRESLDYEQPMVAVYARWGYFPLSFITGKRRDEGLMVDGVIEVADMESGQKPILLRVDKNPFHHGMKPFVECWYQKKMGRWYGIGAAEKLIPLQTYYNRTVNRRIENEDVLHSGIFKIKRGAGLSTKNIVSTPGGVIEVDNMDDVEQLQIRDISQLSDGTIRMINDFVERINGANEITTGSAADRSATTSLIKDRNADTRFATVRGYVNDFLVRFFKQWLALDRQFLDKKFILRVTGEDTELADLDNVLGLNDAERQVAPQFRFIEVDPDTIKGDFDLEVDIDQSVPMNKAENSQRILSAIQTGMKLGLQRDYDKLFDSYLDHIGLQGSKYKTRTPNPNQAMPGMQQGSPSGMPMSEMDQFLNANVPSDMPSDMTSEIPAQVSNQM